MIMNQNRASTNLIKQISRRFPGHSRRDFKKNPEHVCLLRPPSEGTPRAEIPTVWVFQLLLSPPQPNRNLGERHKLPHRDQKRVLVHLELERTHLMAINFVLLRRIFIHIFMTGNQCGRSSTSYTKISRRTN